MNQTSDEALLALYRAGKMDAFDVLYKRHEGGLYRYILRMVQQAHLASDLFQEVWLAVIRTDRGPAAGAPGGPRVGHLLGHLLRPGSLPSRDIAS